MNHAQVIDHERRLYNQFKSEGRRLLHFCPDWDDMAIHSEMDEITACCCDFTTEADNILRDEKAVEIEERRQEPMLMVAAEKSTSQDFSTLGAPAHSGTDLANRVAVACMLVSNDAFKKPGWQKQVNDLLREMLAEAGERSSPRDAGSYRREWSEMIDILFISHRVIDFEYDYVDEIDTFHRSSRIGTFKNGKSFKLAIYDYSGDWLERLKGIEIHEVRCLKDIRISPRERLALQAMMNRG